MNINYLFETLNSVPTSITEEFNTEINYPSSRFPQLEVKRLNHPCVHTYMHNYTPI